MNIVVVVPGGLTEMLQAAPLVASLAAGTAEPVLLAGPPGAAQLRAGLPSVHQFAAVRGLTARPGAVAFGRLWTVLRGRRIDVAVICSEAGSVRAAVYASGIPRRVGVAAGLTDLLLTDSVHGSRGGNRAGDWLALAGPLGIATERSGAEFVPDEDSARAAEQLLLGSRVGDGRLLVAIAPGQGFADAPVAPWGSERFALLANRLATRHGAGVVLVGDGRDRATADAMRPDLLAETIDLCGEIDLGTTAAVIARCDLLIAADTPLLHLAAAVGTASIGLFGATAGRARAPAGPDHRIVQALPNGHSPATLDRIRVDDVLAGVEGAL